MKIKHLILLIFVSSMLPLAGSAADKYCTNLAFELGNFTNWQGFTWVNSTISSVQSTSPVAGFTKHAIMNDTSAYDANTNYKLKKIPKGYKYSARLGDEEANTTVQTLRYTLTVDSFNCFLTYKFAVVLLNPLSGHTKQEEPRFKTTLYDQSGNIITDCSNYDVFASDAELNSSFNSYTPSGTSDPVLWRDWTTVGANLLPYIGQTITIEFLSADCTHKGHYGYAYLVAECQALNIATEYCATDQDAKLIAPEGFQTYNWYDSNNVLLATTQILTVTNPAEGSTYSCAMHSATGCNITLTSTIKRFDPQADFQNKMGDCHSNEVEFTNASTFTKGSLSYLWDFGDGTTSSEKDPKHKFSTSGMHQVTLELTNPPSLCSVKVTKDVESFSPPLVGIGGLDTYCPGESVTLKAYGAVNYEWSTGSTLDSIVVHPPGGKIWLIGRSSNGCISDTIYKTITEEPDWTYNEPPSDTIYCNGTGVTLTASGATSYVWSTGSTSPSAFISQPGDYTLTAFNQRGCSKTKVIKVSEESMPDTTFTVSATTIDSRHNTIYCSVNTPMSGAQYVWNFVDNSKATSIRGNNASLHYSDISLSALYPITLTVTTPAGCTYESSKNIESVPFVANVFSPNGDGVNDVFGVGYSCKILNRYGKVLYSGTVGWDGTYEGKPALADTYFYYITYTDYLGKEQSKKGYITLIR
ncbi:MAG: hypothetical protein H6Q20_245 [Bacteroidetes bacterium]|nr:hypothetical protein [Bacteroidota bacterium]